MRQRLRSVLVVSVVSAAPAAAEAPAIEHSPVACVVAGRFPRLEARFAPVESVARARVQFQAEGTRHWYGVAMTRGEGGFAAVLPQPKKSLKSYRYYLEVTDTALGTSRTPEYSTLVGASGAACADDKTAGGLASAAVRVEVPGGAPSVPGGFSASGVTAVGAVGAAGAAVAAGATTGAAAAGGGIPAAVLIGGGLAVAGAGVAVAASAGGGEGGGGDAKTYEGPFSGQFIVTQNITDLGGVGRDSSTTCFHTRSFTGTMTLTLEQSNGTATGRAQIAATDTAIGVTGGATCTGPGPSNSLSFGCAVTGTPGNLACSDQSTSTSSGGRTSTVTHGFSGALSGGVISGMVTFAFTGQGGNAQTGVTDSASTSFPVTLR